MSLGLLVAPSALASPAAASDMGAPPVGCTSPVRVGVTTLGVIYFHRQGRTEGIDADVVRELARRTGCDFEFVEMNRQRMARSLEVGDFIDMSSTMARTPERDRAAVFVPLALGRPYLLVSGRLAREAGFDFEQFVSDATLRVGVFAGASVGPGGDEAVAKLAAAGRIESIAQPEQAFARLVAGRLDGLIATVPVFAQALKDMPGGAGIRVIPIPGAQAYLSGFYLSREALTEACRQLIRDTLRDMRADGTLLRIFRQYLPEELARDRMAFTDPAARPPPCAVPLRFGVSPLGIAAYVKRGGVATGFDIDLARELASRLGCPLELVELEREQLFEALKSGESIDMTGSISQTPERYQSGDFVPMGTVRQYLLVDRRLAAAAAPGFDLDRFVASPGLRLGLLGRYFYRNFITTRAARLESQGRLVRVDPDDQLVPQLLAGRLDGAIVSDTMAQAALQSRPGGENLRAIPIPQSPAYRVGFFLSRAALSEERRWLIADTLRAMRLDGSLLRIYGRYFPQAIARERASLVTEPPAPCLAPLRMGVSTVGLAYFKRSDGLAAGFDLDISRELARRLACPVKLIEMGRQPLFLALSQGATLDIVGSAMQRQERDRYGEFVQTGRVRTQLLVSRRLAVPGFDLNRFVADPSLRLGVLEGSFYSEYVDARVSVLQQRGQVLWVSEDRMLADLVEGRIDGLLVTQTVSYAALHDPAGGAELRVVPIPESPPYASGFYLSRMTLSEARRMAIADALHNMLRDGTMQRIYRKYMPETAVRERMDFVIDGWRKP